METGTVNLDIGVGRKKGDGFIGIDTMQINDSAGRLVVDHVMDIEILPLPFDESSVDNIKVDNVLEHLENLRFVLNECHRVLKKDGVLFGIVPVAGTPNDFKDPTHKRHFIKSTFSYFTGVSNVNPEWPSHPRYANYGYKPWNLIELKQTDDDLIKFSMSPRK